MKPYPIILALLFSSIGWTQTEQKPIKNSLMVVVSPLHMIEFYHGNSFNIGAEFRMNDRYNFYGEIGKYFKNDLIDYNFDQSGYTLTGEVKRYFNRENHLWNNYLSLQYIYGERNYTREDILGDDEGYISYAIEKTFQDISLRYGTLYVHNKKWVLNPYFGLGIRWHHNITDLSDQQSQELNIRKIEGVSYTPIHAQGKKTFVKIHFGIRFGWRFF